MTWKLYGYTQDGKRVILAQGRGQDEIYAQMGSAGIAHAQTLGCVAWEMKQEGPFNG